MKSYSTLIQLPTFEERFNYLKCNSKIGEDTFGFDRYLNQAFYTSDEWKTLRRQIIIRDNGCDLADPDRPIAGPIIVHHLNPVSVEDILNRTELLLNPDFLICVSDNTHKSIHFGNENNLIKLPKERVPYDTCPWKG